MTFKPSLFFGHPVEKISMRHGTSIKAPDEAVMFDQIQTILNPAFSTVNLPIIHSD